MQDTRLLQMRESLAAANKATCDLIRPLLADCQEVLAELEEENLAPHERVDVAQTRQFLNAADDYTHRVDALIRLALAELLALEAA